MAFSTADSVTNVLVTCLTQNLFSIMKVFHISKICDEGFYANRISAYNENMISVWQNTKTLDEH